MQIAKHMIKIVADQFRHNGDVVNLDSLQQVNFPLPIECPDTTVFQFITEGDDFPIVGVVINNSGLMLMLAGIEDVSITEKRFFSTIEKLSRGRIKKFFYLSNPLGLPNWVRIPDPPKKRTNYRFQYYRKGVWHESVAMHSGAGNITYILDGLAVKCLTIKVFWNEFKYCDAFVWIDKNKKLFGDWPGKDMADD